MAASSGCAFQSCLYQMHMPGLASSSSLPSHFYDSEFSGSHGGDYEDDSLLCCCVA
jgi:hypothetical protein